MVRSHYVMEIELNNSLNPRKSVLQTLNKHKAQKFIYRPNITIRLIVYLPKIMWRFACVRREMAGYKPLRQPVKIIYKGLKKILY